MIFLALCLALIVAIPVVVVACVIARWAAKTRPDRPVRPPLPPVAPQWAADPTGEHEFRFWDGHRWTTQVADGGVARHLPAPQAPASGVAQLP